MRNRTTFMCAFGSCWGRQANHGRPNSRGSPIFRVFQPPPPDPEKLGGIRENDWRHWRILPVRDRQRPASRELPRFWVIRRQRPALAVARLGLGWRPGAHAARAARPVCDTYSRGPVPTSLRASAVRASEVACAPRAAGASIAGCRTRRPTPAAPTSTTNVPS